MSILATETITVVRAPLAANRYGAQIRDWSAATRTDVAGVSIQPTATTEDVRDREQLIDTFALFTPRGIDIDLLATDRVEWNGLTLQVVGSPNTFPMPGGGVHHVEAVLQRIVG